MEYYLKEISTILSINKHIYIKDINEQTYTYNFATFYLTLYLEHHPIITTHKAI